jgi:hypothetical protein
MKTLTVRVNRREKRKEEPEYTKEPQLKAVASERTQK